MQTVQMAAGERFTLGIGAAGTFTVNWGDGQTQTITGNPFGECYSHTYSTASGSNGYTITVSGQAVEFIQDHGYAHSISEFQYWFHPAFLVGNVITDYVGADSYENCTNMTPSKLKSVSGDLTSVFPVIPSYSNDPNGHINSDSIPYFNGTFAGCANLQSVSANLFAGLSDLPDHQNSGGAWGYTGDVMGVFTGTFRNCTSLQSVPSGLFSGMSTVSGYMFMDTFRNSGLTSIPENLFAGIIHKTSSMFFRTFESTRIASLPYSLFPNFTGSGAFERMFASCLELTGYVPPTLFDNQKITVGNMQEIFLGSTNMATQCPSGTTQYVTGFESEWNLTSASNPPRTLSCVASTNPIYTFQLNHHGGQSSLNTLYEKYNTGWATSANPSSWNLTEITAPVRNGWVFMGYFDHEVDDISASSQHIPGHKIWHIINSTHWGLPGAFEVPSSGTSETWYAGWARACAPTAPATCSIGWEHSPSTGEGGVEYQTICPSGYSVVNNGKYNPSCTAGFIDITLNNNGATSAGSTTLRARYGVGVYLDPDATMQMTPQSQNGGSNPITKPQKQFTVNYNAQGGTTANLTNSNKTATFTFGGYRDRDSVAVIDVDGYITSAGMEAQSYTAGVTWTAQWSGGAVTLPNASRPGYTLAGWRRAGNCGGAFVGTPGQSYIPSGNVTLYACWTNVPYYTITLSDGSYNDITQHGYISSTDSNQCTTAGMKYGDGWLNICNATPHVGDTLSLSQVPKRTNYVFAGYWAELAGYESGVDKMIVEPDGDFVTKSEVLVGFTSDSTIGAHWAPKYLITLNPYGGSGGDASVYEGYGIGWSKTQNGDYTETSIIAPSRTGYTFAGYWTDPNFGTRYIRANGTLPDPDSFNSARTLYAHWTPKTYTITLNDNGGSGGLVGDANANCNTAGLQYGTAWVNICASGSGSGGTVSDRGATGDRGATSDGESGKAEGASGDSGDGEKATASSTGLSLYHKPERDGYMFNGYWTATSGGDMIVTPNGNFLGGDILTFTSQNRQIYAHWTSETPSNTIYTITLAPNNNGADGNRPPKIYQKGTSFWADSAATTYQITGSVFDPIADGGAGITRPTPPSGKAFSGYWWDRMTEQFTDAEGIITHVPNFTGDVTVTAHWVNAVTTTVTLNPNGGTACATTSVTATQGQPMPTLTCGPAAPTGYDFTGYYKTADGGHQYYDEQPASVNVWDQTTSTATIYAGYVPAVRDITYQCTAGTDGFVDTATYGSEYTILDFDDVGCSAIAGKKFIGWTLLGNTTFFAPGATSNNWPYYNNLTLVAKYLDIYTVTLRHPDATNNPRPTVAYAIQYTSDSRGYEGWYLDATADRRLIAMNPVPQRGALYEFAGYFYTPDGKEKADEIYIVDETGTFMTDSGTLASIAADGSAEANWKLLSPEFTVATTSLPANTTFRFYIGAAGTFIISWGDEQTQTVSSPGIVSHTYSSAGARTIDIVGDATSYTNAYTTGTIYNTGRVAESAQWSNNTVRPIQLNFPAAIRFGCEAEDTSCTLTPQLVASVYGSLGDVFPTLGTGNTQQPRFSRTFAGCTNLTKVPEDLFGGVYGPAIPGMFYGTFEDSGLVSVGQNLFSGITSFAPHAFQRTFMGSSLLEVPANLFGQIDAAPAEAMFAYTFANTPLRSIPSGIFSGVVGAPAVDMFWGTFSGTTFVPGYANMSALFSGISGAPAKGMFDSTFYNSYNLSGNIPSNLFGGTGLLGAPAERMFASTFYGCYNLSGSIPANLFGGMGLTGASAVGMFDTTFYACIRLSGYVPMTLFGGISTSNPATNMMHDVFKNSGIRQECPCGTHNYTTGFESYWDDRVSCEVGLKPNEHWYGNICVEDCAAGITQIKTSTGLSFQILKAKPTQEHHAIHVSAPSDGTVCYVPLEPGAAANTINVSLNGSAYHTGSVSSTAPSGWDPLTWY